MTEINFGIWDHFERRKGVPIAQQYRDKIRLLQHAEKLGFYAYHVAEHHLTPLDLAPSPNVFLAALAQATTTLRFGTMVYIAPLYHPIRLVQEICMLDNMSGGRLEFGVGRGVRPVEHDWYGVDNQETAARCDEILSILATAMATGSLHHEGRFYRIPDVRLDMLPVQRPYPPIWYAGGVEFAGSKGLNFLGRGQPQIQRYW
jgi:alkanesulfonate monooxygenase SsuD/methylene tetrahydromethanopterin reductase-like flavin-dependent oxidoreductase (luciferase family)